MRSQHPHQGSSAGGSVIQHPGIGIVLFIAFIGVFGGASAIAAEDQNATVYVDVGVWLSDIHTIDINDGSFGAEFYLWWISPDPEFTPFETLQILNGRNWTTKSVHRRTLPDGKHYSSGYVSATINHEWKLQYYPFDQQVLKVIIETPYTASQLRFVPDQEQSIVGEFAEVEGFHVKGFTIEEHIEKYDTDFGFRDEEGTYFSRLIIEVQMARKSQRGVVAVLVGFIVANIIALFTYAIHVSSLSIRVGMLTSAIFSAVGNMYLLNDSFNPASGSLFMDRIAMGTFSVILIALFTGIIVDRIHGVNKIGHARRVNWTVFALLELGSMFFFVSTFQEASRVAGYPG